MSDFEDLIVAIQEHNYVEAFDVLRSYDFTQEEYDEALLEASAFGFMEVAQALIEDHRANEHAIIRGIETPLDKAARNCRVDMVVYLLQVDEGPMDRVGWDHARPILLKMVQTKQSETQGNSVQKDINKAMIRACVRGWVEVVQFLVEECGANIHAKDNDFGYAPLLVACAEGHFDVYAYLVNLEKARGSLFSVAVDEDDDDDPPVMVAVQAGHYEIARHLIEVHGTSANEPYQNGDSVLYAAISGSWSSELPAFLKFVLDQKVNVNTKDTLNRTPLLYTVEEMTSFHRDTRIGLEIMFQLIEAGADVNVVGGVHQRSPLHCACLVGDLTAVDLLLKKGSNVNAIDGDGNSPLLLSCGSLWLTQRLLEEESIDVDQVNQRGHNALTTAALSGRWGFVKALLKRGASVVGMPGCGALVLASKKKSRVDTLFLLVKAYVGQTAV